MGFTRPKAEVAMRRTGGNFEAALDMLMADSLENTTIASTDNLRRTTPQQNSESPSSSSISRGNMLENMMQYPASSARSRRTRSSNIQQRPHNRLSRCVCPTCGQAIQFMPIEGDSVIRCPFDSTLVRVPRSVQNVRDGSINGDRINSAIHPSSSGARHQSPRQGTDGNGLGPMMRVRGQNGSLVQIPLAVLMQAVHDTRDTTKKQPASNAQIYELPVRILKINEISEDQAKCLVCQEDFEVGEEVRTLPCFHIFHTACIDQWLRTSKECPVCKIAIK